MRYLRRWAVIRRPFGWLDGRIEHACLTHAESRASHDARPATDTEQLGRSIQQQGGKWCSAHAGRMMGSVGSDPSLPACRRLVPEGSRSLASSPPSP